MLTGITCQAAALCVFDLNSHDNVSRIFKFNERGWNYRQQKKTETSTAKELNAYARAGMKLWLNGKPSTPSDIMHQCMIREEEEYMRDFVSDDDDHIIGIGFDYIKKKEV